MRWITDQLPDDDLTVLMRLDDAEYPIWPGFREAGEWHYVDASLVQARVTGWLHLDAAAKALDFARSIQPKPRPESNISLPNRRSRGTQRNSWAEVAKSMKPGESILLNLAENRRALLQGGKRIRVKLTSRKIHAQGWRVWRLS